LEVRNSSVAAKYHALGWKIKEIMAATQTRTQEEFVERLGKAGHPISRQLLSEYMRSWAVKDEVTGGVRYEPRIIPSVEFMLAVVRAFDLPDQQKRDLLRAWFSILPPQRQQGLLELWPALRKKGEGNA
jgi:hypothetical protein